MTQDNTPDTDPVTVEVIRNQLLDIAEEMQATVMNAAYSPLWQEAGDLSCAVLNRDAEIVGQADRVIPMHIPTMTNSTQAAIEATGGRSELREGDVLIQNDPYAGNNHLPDFILAQPVFIAESLLGFAAVRGHWVDVGGSSPTSYATDTGEIIQEGLRVPPAKLYESGDRNEALLGVILANMRDQDERLGDLRAQLAGVKRGRKRLLDLAEKYGGETVRAAMAAILDAEEHQVQTQIQDLPDGRYTATDCIDDDGMGGDERVPITAELHVDGTALTVDFDGTASQVAGGVNAPLSCTEAATYYAVKVTLDPGDPGTTGAYRPITVEAPKGSLVNPEHPAPVVAGNHETATRIYDVVLQCIAAIDSELAFAAGDGSSNVVNYQSNATDAMNYTCMGGGMGACPDRDGINAIRSGVGNTGVQPIERVESEYNFVTVEEFTIVPDTGGAGEYRGGNTIRRVLRFDDETDLVITGERATTRPFGLAGGHSGSFAEHRHVQPDGTEVELSSKVSKTLPAGSKLRFQPAGGGGFGEPTDRSPTAVLADVQDEYVTEAVARDQYGVAIDADTGEIDTDETRLLRSE